MAKVKTKADEYKEIFVRLHKYQRKGADNLILLLTRFVRAKAEYMTQYIDIVAERSGVCPTGHITTTNADIMLPVVRAIIEIEQGSVCEKDLGLVFSRKPAEEITLVTKRHEQTHTFQQYEILGVSALISLVLCNIFASWWYLLGCLVIPFAVYVLGFLIEAFMPPYHNAKACFEGKCFCDKVRAIPTWFSKVWMDAYRDNCFEREAYMNDHDRNYLATRSLFAWVGYILKKADRNGK